jgi:hypothetical protein
MTDDQSLDRISRHILADIEEMRRLEREKRETARSSPEFHALSNEVERAALHVHHHATQELLAGHDDSPDPEERAEQHPGDWTAHAPDDAADRG